MNLYIEIENGATKNHPALEENLIQAFGEVPTHWESFVRVERPTLGIYEVMTLEQATYEKVNGVWTDVWHKQEITAEEKTAKQQAVITEFNNREYASNWSAWTLDEATCTMLPPIPRPEPDETKISFRIFTMWCGSDANWKDTPAKPQGQYKFDFIAWNWVAI
jgi:hypothetical protein